MYPVYFSLLKQRENYDKKLFPISITDYVLLTCLLSKVSIKIILATSVAIFTTTLLLTYVKLVTRR